MKRELLGFATAALLVFGLGCVKDPTASLRGGGAVEIQTSFSYVQVNVADSVAVTAVEKDAQGDILVELPEVTSLDPTVLAVTISDVPPNPGRRFYVKGLTYGIGKVLIAAGDVTDTVTVQTWPASITITGVPDTLRSDATATATPTALDAAGAPVAGVPITLATGDAAVLQLNAATNVVTALKAGLSTLTATGPNELTGTFLVRVVSAVPASAALSGTTFGAVGAAGTSKLELKVLDAQGNQNTSISEITSVAVSSSNPGIATVAATVVDTAAGGTERHVFVTATGVAGGTANVSGSVTTVSGTFPFAATPVIVLAPVITVSAPSSLPAAVITINGAGFTSAGYRTLVLVDSAPVGNITSMSATQITAQMPTLLAGAHSLRVSVGGVLSNTDTWTQTANFNEASTEPNDAPAQAAPISASFNFNGSADETTDPIDLFEFTTTADSLITGMTLSWSGASIDIDVLIYPKGAQQPGTYTVDNCKFALSSTRNPETGSCQLGAAGVYTVEIDHFGSGPTTYTLKGTLRTK